MFLDMCNRCYKDIEGDVPTIARDDLSPTEEIELDAFDVDAMMLEDE
jgi:hypothetical protein